MYLYIFVLAAVIAVLGIIRVFRSTVDNMLTEPEKVQQYMSGFFTKVALVEFLPIILVILGFVFLQGEQLEMADVYVPIAIIVILIIFNMFYVFSQRSPAGNVEQDMKQRIQTLIFLTIALANSIPFIAIIFIILSVN
ncbi:hypothetical protein [Oceanobacillus sojae]|uniref:hypothetical protein n=1 Tax=Oceanobacillus sojae TaxID=582851 RepID=UPI0021A7D8AC|nr:hypothetical protein [Oceanobacillus sojae]MCT1905343.1 hypothetical protein [Oceanobacillus sojae]